MLNGISDRQTITIRLKVSHGAEKRAPPRMAMSTIASSRTLRLSRNEPSDQVATLEMIRNAEKADQGATKRGSFSQGQCSPLASQSMIGSNITPAPAGAGTPVRKPADLWG